MMTIASARATTKSRVHARASRRKGCDGRGSSVEATVGGGAGSIIFSALISYTMRRRAASRRDARRGKNLLAGSFLRGEQCNVVRHAKRPTPRWIVTIDPLDSRDVPHESASRDIEAESRLPSALRAVERRNYFPRRIAAVHFADHTNVRAERITKRRPVKRLIVLRVERVGRRHNLDANIAERIELTEVALEIDLGIDIRRIVADAARLVRIRHDETECHRDSRTMVALAEEPQFRAERKITDVMGRIRPGKIEVGNKGRALLLHVQKL